MKKVLILAYDTPPYNSIGGQRPWSWYQYFAEHGWHPVLVSRHWDRLVASPLDALLPSQQTRTTIEQTDFGTLIRVPNKAGFRYQFFVEFAKGRLGFLRRAISLLASLLGFFWVGFDNKGGLYRAARQYMKQNKVDAIIATGDPYLLFHYAKLLGREFGVPWVADYRDCWSNQHEITHVQLNFFEKIHTNLFRYIEKRTVGKAALITCPGTTSRAKLQELFPQKNIQLVYNGYFESVKPIEPLPLSAKGLNISHGGTLYPFQPFEVFAAGLEILAEKTGSPPDIQVNWFGSTFYKEQELRIRSNSGVSGFFTTTDRLPREELLFRYMESDLLLMFASRGLVAAKVFDYILAGRPILLVGNEGGELEDLVLQYRLGYVCRDAREVAAFLQTAYTQKQQGIEIPYHPGDGLEFFSRKHQAGILCEFLDKHLMPLIKQPLYRICTRCVMDSSDPDIVFDHEGKCNHCTEFLENRLGFSYQGQKSDEIMQTLVEAMKAKGKGKKYDCVLGLSGGIDSSYAALIARQHGLRVLAVHLDNGWNSEEAVSNIKNIAGRLGIDLEVIAPDPDEFKDLQLSFLKASVPEAETPTDIAIPAVLHRVAARHGVKYIISGGNYATEGIMPIMWHYNARDTRYLSHIHKRFGTGRIRNFPLFGFLHEMYYKLIKGVKTIYLLNYVPYSKELAMEKLTNELDWRWYGGKHHESKYTGFIQGFYLFKKFGIDYRRAAFSTMICHGKMKREQALKALEPMPYKEEKIEMDKRQVAIKLGITEADLEDIMKTTPKWYRNYPNNEKMLAFIYNTYRRIYRKKKSYNF